MPQRRKPLPRVIRYTFYVHRSCCRLHVASCPSAFDSFNPFYRFARPGRSLGWHHRQGGLPPGLTPPHPSSRAEGRWVSKTRRIWNIYLLPDGTSNLGNFDSAPLKGRALLSTISGGRVEEIPLAPTQSRLPVRRNSGSRACRGRSRSHIKRTARSPASCLLPAACCLSLTPQSTSN